jgi:hypothetical protein
MRKETIARKEMALQIDRVLKTTNWEDKMITLKNDFHGTKVNLKPHNGLLTKHQIKRAWQTLCGIHGCTCGNDLGMRGSNQTVFVKQDRQGNIYATV